MVEAHSWDRPVSSDRNSSLFLCFVFAYENNENRSAQPPASATMAVASCRASDHDEPLPSRIVSQIKASFCSCLWLRCFITATERNDWHSLGDTGQED